MDSFYNFPELACFLKSRETDCISALCITEKLFFPWLKKNCKKKREWFGLYSRDLRAGLDDDNIMAIFSTCHTDEIRVSAKACTHQETAHEQSVPTACTQFTSSSYTLSTWCSPSAHHMFCEVSPFPCWTSSYSKLFNAHICIVTKLPSSFFQFLLSLCLN
jgi:hypothetical protein